MNGRDTDKTAVETLRCPRTGICFLFTAFSAKFISAASIPARANTVIPFNLIKNVLFFL